MSKAVKVGKITIGGGRTPVVQTMTNVDTADGVLLLSEIKRLSEAGAEIIRATVNDEKALLGFEFAAKNTDVPLVADIHFDYRLAVEAALRGAAAVRINPGNIGSEEKIKEVVSACADRGIPIRVGANSGSIEKTILEKYGRSPEALVESALLQVDTLEKYAFDNIVISVKSSDVSETVAAYRALSKRTDYPLHLGVTEAGGGEMALIKSSIGIGSLLLDGIGDTIRVSLSDDPIKEVYAAKNILRAIGLDKNFVDVISCPTCGRTTYDVIGVSAKVREMTKDIKTPLKIAVMGCIVNGLGEGAEADIGVAGGKEKSVLFEKGEVIATVRNEEVEERLKELIEKHVKNG